MSDDSKSLLEGLGDLDWDNALDEWEKNSFDPAVAPEGDKAQAKAGAVADAVPVIPQVAPADDVADEVTALHSSAALAKAYQSVPSEPPPDAPADESVDEEGLDEDQDEDQELENAGPGTLIAPVPRELRDSAPGEPSAAGGSQVSVPPARPSSPASRGGLNQLFSKPRAPGAPPPATAAPPAARSSKPLIPRPVAPAVPPAVPRPPGSAPSRDKPSEETRVMAPLATTQRSATGEVGDLADANDGGEFASETRQLAAVPAAAGARESGRTIVERPAFDPPDAAAIGPATDRDAMPEPTPEPGPLPEEPEQAPIDDVTAEHPSLSKSGASASLTGSTRAIASRVRQSLEDSDENQTLLRDRDRESFSDADTATRHPAEDEAPTLGRPSARPGANLAGAEGSGDLRVSPRDRGIDLEEHRPVKRWLDDAKTAAFTGRVDWLEDEARAVENPLGRARALVAVSELCALYGDRERALSFAMEARETAPDLPLAWRQTRQLMVRDPELLVEALDAEALRSPTPSARAHATLMAADLLRMNHLGDAAVERWESACKLDPADTRGPIARAAIALAQNDHSNGCLRLADNSELVPFDKALATALRLRGVERAGAEVDDMPINDGLRHARLALEARDVVVAAQSIGEIVAVGELAKGAHWLSAALGASHIASRRAAARSLKTLAADRDPLARRQLAARGIELGDPELAAAATAGGADNAGEPFDAAERAVLRWLATPKGDEPLLDTVALTDLGADADMRPLVDALASLFPAVSAEDDAIARAGFTAGGRNTRALATLGRLLAAKAPATAIDDGIEAVDEPRQPSAAGVAIETAVRGSRWGELSEALSSLPEGDDAAGNAQRHIAAAIVAERGERDGDRGDRGASRDRARAAWTAAARTGATSDGILRIAGALDGKLDLGAEILRLADAMPDNVASAILRLEGLARTSTTDEEQAGILERIHRAAPALGIGGFLAERIGRRKGDLDEVLRWIQERRAHAGDPLETALDSVREALLVADRDPELASTRLEEAHRARPDDVALRELYERLATEPPADRGAWREKRAESQSGSGAALLWIEAALEHERAGDLVAGLRAARRAAEAGDRGLSTPLIERGEIEAGDPTRQVAELIDLTRSTTDDLVRREALERLAHLERVGRKDPSAATAWHRAILEFAPRHKPSLRWLEHGLISAADDADLPPIFEQIALALDGSAGGEVTAHAQHAARLRVRDGAVSTPGDGAPTPWEKTQDMARLAATQPEASLWALRALNAHSRVQKDDAALLRTTLSLLDRTQRSAERATLLLRASEASSRLEEVAEARSYLEQAAEEDPGDVVTWGFLAEMRGRAGEERAAAEACESLARTSVVREHQLLAWHDAAKIWLDEVNDGERAMSALESAAEIDVTYADVFPRLSALYADKNLDSELARLLEKRLATVQDDDERVSLEVELARAFAEMGELAKAKGALESALDKRPSHATALAAMADLCSKEGDWTGAEHAYVRLARLLSDPAEQRAIYERLGEIYSVHAPNLSRAEVALKEVLKRSPDDVSVLLKLVDIFKRQGDVPKAVETQQQLVALTTDPAARLANLVELAKIYESVGRDPRRSEQVLDSARKEFPTSVVALRAMAEFYARQHQMPAMQILLDRAAGDARRSFAQGRFVPALFQVLHAAFELRGKRDAARVVAATLAAVEGQPSDLGGGDARAVDPRLDDLLAPDIMSPALRALLFRAGDSLDVVAPVDLRSLKATPLQPGSSIGATIGSVATVIGLGALQILVSPQLGRVATPLASNPPTLLIGEGLARTKNERARVFVVVRALKMILAHASAMVRSSPQDVAPLIAGLFVAFNPSYVPQGVNSARAVDYARRIGPAIPRSVDPTVGVIALEAAGMLGTQWNMLGPAAAAWANRVALLAVGDPNAALDAIAWDRNEERAPTGAEERAAWIARHAEARELMTFSVTDACAEARIRLGLDK